VQASLEIAFWVALLTFPLMQIAVLLIAQADPDTMIRYLTTSGLLINMGSFAAFVYAVVHAIVFLASESSGWGLATSVIAGVSGLVTVVALIQLHSLAANIALAKGAVPRQRRRR